MVPWGGQAKPRNQQNGITNADWFRVGGGDGFFAQVDPTDYNTVYAESQGGAMQRLDLRTGPQREYSSAWCAATRRPGGGGQAGRRTGCTSCASGASPSPGASPSAELRQLRTRPLN